MYIRQKKFGPNKDIYIYLRAHGGTAATARSLATGLSGLVAGPWARQCGPNSPTGHVSRTSLPAGCMTSAPFVLECQPALERLAPLGAPAAVYCRLRHSLFECRLSQVANRGRALPSRRSAPGGWAEECCRGLYCPTQERRVPLGIETKGRAHLLSWKARASDQSRGGHYRHSLLELRLREGGLPHIT